MRKDLIFFALALSSIFLIASCKKNQPSSSQEKQVISSLGIISEKTGEQQEDTTSINLIFAQTAQSALIEKLGNQGYYMLTLYDVNPYLTYYTERPDRKSGIVPVTNFIKAWEVGHNSFQENSPNALLTAATIDDTLNKGPTFYLMKCTTPEYTINKGTLSYVVKPLPNQHFIFDHIKLGHVVLVID